MCTFQRPWAVTWQPASKPRYLVDSVAGSAGHEEDLDVVFLHGGRWGLTTVVPSVPFVVPLSLVVTRRLECAGQSPGPFLSHGRTS